MSAGYKAGAHMTRDRDITFESLAIVAAAVVVAAAATGVNCYSHSVCTGDNTCVGITHNGTAWLPQCSFRMAVPLASNLLYTNSSADSMVSLTRGYCGVGERLQLLAGSVQCGPFYPYPDALNAEIMDPSASTDSFRACGKWLGSGVSLTTNTEYYAFDGNDARVASTLAASAAGSAGTTLSRGNIGKFRAACHRTVLSGGGALGAAGKLAYDHLIAQLPPINNVDDALAAAGVLTGHYCDGVASMGWNYASQSAPRAFLATIGDGARFGADAMAQALELVEASHATIAAAEAANTQVNSRAVTSPILPWAALERFFEGATGRTDHAAVTVSAGITGQLDGFYELAGLDLAAANAYLHGVAAMCSFSMQSTIDVIGYTARIGGGGAARDVRARRDGKPAATTLGRLRPSGEVDAILSDDLDNETMHNATSATITQLVGSAFADTESTCLAFARALFPDETDQTEFDLVITPSLYTRLQTMTETIRSGIVSVLHNNSVIRDVLVDPDLVASDVQQVRVRIPGAPRGTWAGSARSVPVAQFSSSDGIFVMAAKQARAVFLDRQADLVFTATDICEGPAVFDALSTNAYIYASRRCSYYLLGMAFRPFADEQYSDESLASRMGYVIAHEMAHTTLNTQFVLAPYESLLQRYPDPNTYPEAIADVLAGLGLINAGLVNSSRLCMHIAQTWCGRVPPLYYLGTSSHPKSNVRGDSFCATMRDLGV